MRFGRICLAFVLTGACVTAATAAVGATPRHGPSRHLAVVGFQEAGDSPRLIAKDARALATVGVDGVNLTANARSTTAVSRTAKANQREAKRRKLRTELLFGNWSNTIGDFSEPIAHKLLSSRSRMRSVSARLAGFVRRQHWSGVSIDLESLRARDRGGLIEFLTVLRTALPHRAAISICISGRQSDASFRAGGYEIPRIAPRVNRIEYMTYDEHGPWENTPGPVGDISWQKRCLRALLKYVSPDDVDLGVAGYGYGWLPHRNVMLSDREARKLAGKYAAWKPRIGEWTAHLPNGGTLWWSDARSYARRADLARHWRLHGLAVWDLRLSDRIS